MGRLPLLAKNGQKLLKRTNELIKAIIRDSFEGIGKPEPLKHGLSGYWSRRINDEHRIVYKILTPDLIRHSLSIIAQ